MPENTNHPGDAERVELLEMLEGRRRFLRFTARGLTDEQAAATPTVSRLCVGGIIKHVSAVERSWIDFIRIGPAAMGGADAAAMEAHAATFRMLDGETLQDVLDRYQETAAETEKGVSGLSSLDLSHPLPEAPWFPPGARWTARHVLLHIIAETAHHSGHADIIREAIDGQRTMG